MRLLDLFRLRRPVISPPPIKIIVEIPGCGTGFKRKVPTFVASRKNP